MKPDVVLPIAPGKPYTILQLTDMQVINYTPDEPMTDADGNLLPPPDDIVTKCFQPVEKTIRAVSPDLIVITGDIVYGCFDKNGYYLRLMIDFLESFGLPWAPVFGNHDRPDFALGIDYLCRAYEEAPHCLFCRGNLSGQGNYTLGLAENDELVRVLYMMDSDGYYLSGEDPERFYRGGFARDQLRWLVSASDALRGERSDPVPGFLLCHNPTADYSVAVLLHGYLPSLEKMEQYPIFIGTKEQAAAISPELNYVEGTYPPDGDKSNTFLCVPPKQEGDFGFRGNHATVRWATQILEPILYAAGIDHVFAGHNHRDNFSVYGNGIRYVTGVKGGIYDRCGVPESQTGGRIITIETDRTVVHTEPFFNGCH